MRPRLVDLEALHQRIGRSEARDYLLTLSAALLVQTLGVVSGVLTARGLGPAGKGDLATIYWLPSMLATVGTLGIPQAAALEISRRPEDADLTAIAALWLSLGLGVLQILVAFLLLPLIFGAEDADLLSIERWFLLYVPLALTNLAFLGVDQGRQDFTRYSLYRLLPTAIYVGFLILFLLVSRVSLVLVVAANLGATLVAVSFRLFRLRWQSGVPLCPRSVLPQCRRLLSAGWRLHLPAMAGLLLAQADMALLVGLAPARSIGYYSVGLSLALAQISLSHTVAQVGFPKIASRTHLDARQYLQRQLRIAAPLVGGVSLLVLIASPFLIQVLFGSAFLPAVEVSRWLIIAMMVWGWGQMLDHGLRALHRTAPGIVANVLGLVVLLATGGAWFNSSGIVGMARSVLLAQVTVTAVLLVWFWVDLHVQPADTP